ncbi:neuronal acetylcholine receptor subunit alpha-7-like [Amphiura filiformis]|uniref:neuronal acetylcholine receptor subunit alpha-7-like n=1 Tax=Amphiura filiformis TaxID=82378 RepID=UPI003B210B9A
MVITYWILLCLLSTMFKANQATKPKGDHFILTKELLSDYGPTTARPVMDVKKRINVEIDLEIARIVDLNERDQTLQQSVFIAMQWQDDFLTWNTSVYPDVDVLIMPTDQIWRPDIHVYENVDKSYENVKDVSAWVYPDGTVLWIFPSILHTACRIDARLFPFDTQHCTLRFGSWSYNTDQLNLQPRNDTHTIYQKFIENGVWQLEDIFVQTIINEYQEGMYSEVVYTIRLRRRPLFHVLSFIVPCGLLSLLNLLVFILPTESGEKVSLGITNLLALIVFQQLITDSLPPSYMPILGYYFTPMILIGCLSIVSGVLVAALYHQDQTRPVPKWLCKLTCIQPLTIAINQEPEPYINEELTTLPDSSETCEMKHGDIRDDIKMTKYGRGIFANVEERDVLRYAEDHLRSRRDYTSDWQKVASVIERIILTLGIVLTITAIIVTAVLFTAT